MKNRLPVYMNGRLPACIFDQMKRKSDRKSKTTIESRLPAKMNRKTRRRLNRSQFRFNENRLPATNLNFLLTCWCFWNYCQSCWNRKKMVDAKKWSKMKPMVENNLTTFFGRIWKPIFDHSTIFRKLLTRPFVSPYVLPKTQIRSFRRSPAAFAGYRLVL